MKSSFLLLVLLACTGCVPQITWLPDSSGFVYTAARDGQRLVHFDLATNKQQVLVSDTECQTARAAVSPDGKRIAVARINHLENIRDQWQVLVFDLKGNLVQKSGVFSEEGLVEGETRLGQTSELFWGPGNIIVINNLAISTVGSFSNIGNATRMAIYDLEKDRMVIHPGRYVPAFGGTPFRPDGQSFIVAAFPHKGEKKKNRLSLMDQRGNSKRIAVPTTDSDDPFALVLYAGLCDSSWHGNVATSMAMGHRIKIDTDKLEASYHSDPPDPADSKEAVIRRHVFANGRKAVQFVALTKEVFTDDDPKPRFEVFDIEQKKAAVLIENGPSGFMFPSPNAKYVAVRWLAGRIEPSESIWVIDQEGKIVAKIKEW